MLSSTSASNTVYVFWEVDELTHVTLDLKEKCSSLLAGSDS
jgi:hypothetical protein